MNGDSPHGGQPWSVDLLADLHADGADRSGLDADALAVLTALDATQVDLAALPPMRMPDHVAARLDAVLAAEAAAMRPPAPIAPVAPVVDLAEARRRRNRRLGIGGGLLTAAAVAVSVIFAVLPSSTGGVPQAAEKPTTGPSGIQTDPPTDGTLSLRADQLPAAAVKAIGTKDLGYLADAAKLSACVRANGQDPKASLLGARQVNVDGKRGVLLVLSTGKVVRYQLLVVGTNCSAGNPDTIANSTIGG
jgi:hypothetical protein